MRKSFWLWPVRVPFWMLGTVFLLAAEALGMEPNWDEFTRDRHRALWGGK